MLIQMKYSLYGNKIISILLLLFDKSKTSYLKKLKVVGVHK